jgi:hypothetical protein
VILGRSYAALGAPSLSERAFQTDQPSPIQARCIISDNTNMEKLQLLIWVTKLDR